MPETDQPTPAETTAPTAPEPTEAPVAEAPPAAPKPTETVEFWKQKAREQESRAKSNADAAKRLQEIEDAQKSAEQRSAEATARLQRERDEATAEALRLRVMNRFGLTEDDAELLGTGDEETLTRRAERLSGLAKAAAEGEVLRAQMEATQQGRAIPAKQPVSALKPGASAVQVETDDIDAYPAHWIPQRAG